nr:SDR family NAD(P)-dependent oxidoreductase [Mycoplasmopsis bovis]
MVWIAVLPSMIKENSGTIINISSTAGRFTYDDHSVYNGSKFVSQCYNSAS